MSYSATWRLTSVVYEGGMRVAYITTRNTSNNCSAPLTQYKLIWECECVGLPTLQYRQVILSLPPPTCVWEGCWVHFPWAVCMHALDLSHYTRPSTHNTILGTSWHSTNEVVYCSVSRCPFAPAHTLTWGETKHHTHTVVLHTQQPLQYYFI